MTPNEIRRKMGEAAQTISNWNKCLPITDYEIFVAIQALSFILAFLENAGPTFSLMRIALWDDKESLLRCARAREWNSNKLEALEK
jgi:uncharacterized membrane protein